MKKHLIPLLLACSALTAQAAESQTLKKIADTGVIYLGHNEASLPFSYVLPDRVTPAGFTWEVCGRVVQALESKLGKSVQIVPTVASTAGRFYMVKTGMTDIECGASTHTAAREKLASFSTTFYVSETRLMVHADSGIRSFDDLAGKTVLTASGSAAERLVKQTALQRNLAIRQVQSRSPAESMAMLERGEVDVYVADDATLATLRARSTSPERYVLLDDSLSVEPYALVLPKDDPAFKAMVDETLVDLMKSGELEKIYSKWFTQPIPPAGKSLDLPLSALNKSTWQFPNDKPAN